MNIWEILYRTAHLYPEKIAVIDANNTYTYKQIKNRVTALSRFIESQHLNPGDRISILEVNSQAFLEVYFAAAATGTILSPLNYRLSAKEIAFILNDSGSRWLIANLDFVSLVKEILAEPTQIEGILWIGTAPDIKSHLPSFSYEKVIQTNAGPFEPGYVDENQPAHLYYTSGTTGTPKGVLLTHKNVCVHSLGAIAEIQLADTDVWGHFAPMFHLADAWATFAVTWVGGRHVMSPYFDAKSALSLIEQHHITLSNLVPTMLNMMINHPHITDFDFSSLRVILSGGAPIAPKIVADVLQILKCDYIQTYGMTETSPYLTLSVLKDHLKHLPVKEQIEYKAKTGRPFITVDLKVVDKTGEPVMPDNHQVGEIWARGDTITPGYWQRPEETRHAFSDGWLRTGDLAVVDKEGYLNIVDRKKDIIISGGENIYSIEVENVIYMHPKVLEVAAFGVPDEKWGESVKAAVVLKQDEVATEEEIIDFCRNHLARFKLPKSILFLEELPKTGSGKLYKKGLRDLFA